MGEEDGGKGIEVSAAGETVGSREAAVLSFFLREAIFV